MVAASLLQVYVEKMADQQDSASSQRRDRAGFQQYSPLADGDLRSGDILPHPDGRHPCINDR
jgi:hypothetical protein